MNPPFSISLLAWYKKNSRKLPWRKTRDPYKIWISEIMLQQTTVNAVIPYYERWVEAFPTVHDVARQPLQKILSVWQGLGYYQRAKNIHKAAQMICEIHDGKVPNVPEKLKELPGFGPYTLGAVLSIAFNKRFSIIDANVRRVVMRQLAIKGFANNQNDVQITDFLMSVMPYTKISDFNQALMELGALICRSREPLCILCPVQSNCQAFKLGIQEIIPTPKRKEIKEIDAVIAIIRKNNKVLIQRRPSTGLLADLWEFPGGKIEAGETPEAALKREVQEELDITVIKSSAYMKVSHFYTQFKVNLQVFQCELESFPRLNSSRKWVTLEQLASFPMPSGSVKIAQKLRDK